VKWLADPRADLQPNEMALMFCFICKCREVYKTREAAEKAWKRHRSRTGHDVGLTVSKS
jgi:hypothetical protein